MKNYIESHFKQLKCLPLFTKISEDKLRRLLKKAYIKNFRKNENLFFRDEAVTSFYILLSGGVRFSISNEEGQEAILQIAKPGDFIGDLFSKTLNVDAQIIDDSIILAIPAKEFLENMQQNLQLALNMLSEISEKNREFINQNGSLKIGNAKQKVGRFLLRSAFRNGDKKNEKIDLECDKKTIASYLGVRSETFSRVLKKLKTEGEINIKKDKIILLKKHSLCSFCDSEISAKCSDHDSSFCNKI